MKKADHKRVTAEKNRPEMRTGREKNNRTRSKLNLRKSNRGENDRKKSIQTETRTETRTEMGGVTQQGQNVKLLRDPERRGRRDQTSLDRRGSLLRKKKSSR